MNKKNTLHAIAVTGIMSALGFVLMLLEISVPIMPVFIKLDFSELPALITSFLFGPIYGIAVCLVKNLLHLFASTTSGVGELANFLFGIFFVGVAGAIYKHKKNRTSALIGSIAGAAIMSIACVFINYYITYPVYYQIFAPEAVILSLYQTILPSVKSIYQALFIFNLPFTFVKGLLDAVICFLIYKKISPILKKQR